MVIKTPALKIEQNILSILNIGLLTYKNEKFGVSESFEDFLKYNYDGSMRHFLHDRKRLARE